MQRKIKRRYAYGKEQYGCQSLDEGQGHSDAVEEGPYLALLACESQSGVHYAMPVRNMLYDSLSYTEQIRRISESNRRKEGAGKMSGEEFLSGLRKEDRICPVITLVLYYGEKEWDGSRDLYGMFPGGQEEQMRKMLKNYVPDYRINLVDVGKIHDPEKFTSDLQLIFGMLKYRGDMPGAGPDKGSDREESGREVYGFPGESPGVHGKVLGMRKVRGLRDKKIPQALDFWGHPY